MPMELEAEADGVRHIWHVHVIGTPECDEIARLRAAIEARDGARWGGFGGDQYCILCEHGTRDEDSGEQTTRCADWCPTVTHPLDKENPT
jgi:hypothetical protein